jgi:hypothetical protein
MGLTKGRNKPERADAAGRRRFARASFMLDIFYLLQKCQAGAGRFLMPEICKAASSHF